MQKKRSIIIYNCAAKIVIDHFHSIVISRHICILFHIFIIISKQNNKDKEFFYLNKTTKRKRKL